MWLQYSFLFLTFSTASCDKEVSVSISEPYTKSTPTEDHQDQVPKTYPENCLEIKHGDKNLVGIYTVKPRLAQNPFRVFCNTTRKGGGWTTILNRFDGSVDFDLHWKSYRNGFGNLSGEFWLGLENIHQLIGNQVHELLVELVYEDNRERYAHYKNFSIGSENEGYFLKTLNGYSGFADDHLSAHVGARFYTNDRDHAYCANDFTGGWWYQNCADAHLTGSYTPEFDFQRIRWSKWGPQLKTARMLIKPKK